MAGETRPDSPVIDLAAHLYPESVFPDELRGSTLLEHLGPALYDPDHLLSMYREADIDNAVLSLPLFLGGYAEYDRIVPANDALLEVVQSYGSLYGLSAIPVGAGGEEAAAEFERCLAEGYHGGTLETRSGGIELTDEALEPVFEVAERRGAPILVHPKLNDSVHPDVLDDSYHLNSTIGRGVALVESLCKVIHMGVLDRYPELTLVYHHYGGNISSLLGRIEAKIAEGRRRGEDQTKTYAAFKTQLEERIYIDTGGYFGYHAPLQTALGEFPSSHVLFATDYPFEPYSVDDLRSFRRTVEDVTSLTDTARILGGNALDLLINVE